MLLTFAGLGAFPGDEGLEVGRRYGGETERRGAGLGGVGRELEYASLLPCLS